MRLCELLAAYYSFANGCYRYIQSAEKRYHCYPQFSDGPIAQKAARLNNFQAPPGSLNLLLLNSQNFDSSESGLSPSLNQV